MANVFLLFQFALVAPAIAQMSEPEHAAISLSSEGATDHPSRRLLQRREIPRTFSLDVSVPYSLVAVEAAPTLQGQLELPAANFESGPPPSTEVGGPAKKTGGKGGRDWRWRRAALPEYLIATTAIAGTLYLESENRHPAEAKWRGHDGFDEAIRDGLRLGSASARDAMRTSGDVLMGVLIAAPLVDSMATLGIRDANWDVLWQTSMVNLESFTFTALVSSLGQNFLRREKPLVRNCRDINNCDESQPNRSMPSGHTAFAFTGAGLFCTHHKFQSLYADPSTERALCATGLTLATATGVIRIMADGHYATDVVAGAAIGLFSGFVLPRLLHYSWPQAEKGSDSAGSFFKQAIIAPQVLDGGGGLACRMTF